MLIYSQSLILIYDFRLTDGVQLVNHFLNAPRTFTIVVHIIANMLLVDKRHIHIISPGILYQYVFQRLFAKAEWAFLSAVYLVVVNFVYSYLRIENH